MSTSAGQGQGGGIGSEAIVSLRLAWLASFFHFFDESTLLVFEEFVVENALPSVLCKHSGFHVSICLTNYLYMILDYMS